MEQKLIGEWYGMEFRRMVVSYVLYAEYGTRSGGSVTLKPLTLGNDSILLTRQYDIANYPIISDVMNQAFSVFYPEGLLKDIINASVSDLLP